MCFFVLVFFCSFSCFFEQLVQAGVFMCTPKSWIGNVGAGNKGSHGGFADEKSLICIL